MIEKLTDEQRAFLSRHDAPVSNRALRVIDQLTGALEAEHAEAADWLQVSRDWRERAESAEARIAAAVEILSAHGSFVATEALRALRHGAPDAKVLPRYGCKSEP